jgi:hypothetical protein
LIPKGDFGLLYVILKNLNSAIGRELLIPDLLTFKVEELLDKESSGFQHLDGRILQLLASWRVKNVQFWLHLESLYKKKLPQEESFKLIEALVGLGMVQRGSTDFIQTILDEVVKRKL